MLIRHRGSVPQIDPTAFVAQTAVLAGRVTVGAKSRLLYGAVLNAEAGRIDVSEYCIISENAALRATAEAHEHALQLEDHVLVGPHAFLAGCCIQRCAYIATAVTVLYGAIIESGASIGVGAFVHAKTRVPREFFVPPGCIAIGDPIRVYTPTDPSVPAAIKALNFAETAFGITRPWEDRINRYLESIEVRVKKFEVHFGDQIV